MKKENIVLFFDTLRAANPEPETELEYSTPFELMAAVLLSAQATDVGVNKATRKLFPVAHTPQAILDLGIEGLESYIKTIGLYHSKAKHLIEACRMLVELHGGEVPRTMDELTALAGVGPGAERRHCERFRVEDLGTLAAGFVALHVLRVGPTVGDQDARVGEQHGDGVDRVSAPGQGNPPGNE